MARRKSGFLSDGSSDSDASLARSDIDPEEDADHRAERELFEGGRRKRPRLERGAGKAAAWEGIFGEDDEEAGGFKGGRAGRGKGRDGPPRGSKRFTAPTFVSSDKKTVPDLDIPPFDAGAGPKPEQGRSAAEPAAEQAAHADGSDMDMDGSSEDGASASEDEKAGRSPRRPASDDESEEEGGRPSGGGIGSRGAGAGIGMGMGLGARNAAASFMAAGGNAPPALSREASSSTAGIGSARRHQADAAAEASLHPAEPKTAFPQSFGASRDPPSIMRNRQPAFRGRQASPPPVRVQNVAAADMRHLQSISSSFGARLLAKQGWSAGKGLGLQEDGKAVPIQANLNLSRGQGIGRGVRTEQSKREARERGERFSSDEEEERRAAKKERAKTKSKEGPAEGANWRKEKKVKIRVEHKTYDQLLAEAGQQGGYAGVGPILDARGAELKEVESLSGLALSSWTPTSDKTRLPELRHNLQLILDVTKGDVLALAKEGKGVKEKREWNVREMERLSMEQTQQQRSISELQSAGKIVESIADQVQASRRGSPDDPLAPVSADLETLLRDFRPQYDEHHLDEVAVGAIAHFLKDTFRRWQPLEDDTGGLLTHLKRWQKAYRFSDASHEDAAALDLFGSVPSAARAGQGSNAIMTPYEAMMNALWLPKVRSAINNDWDPQQPHAAVALVEQWTPILPTFMRDNVLDQLIMPKLHKKVRDWTPRPRKGESPKSLAAVIFPWLNVLGPRADDLLEEAKMRIGEVMKKWHVRDAIPEEFPLWREVFARGKWDTLILVNILPKLAAHLDADFEVNPRAQDNVPLDHAMAWSGLMRESTFSQLLEERFFPKWLDTLHFWLIQPNYNASEVASWYHYWKDLLSKHSSVKKKALDEVDGIAHGLRYGLRLMNDAMALGTEAPTMLRKPDFKPLPSGTKASLKKSTSRRQTPAIDADQPEVTFRAIAEKHAADHNLLFVPTGSSHPATGKPLFKVSKSLDGRGGVTVYVGEDAVYAMVSEGVFRAVLLDDMVKMAGAL